MPTAEQIAESLDPWPDDPLGGWPAWAFSNHDAERIANRWNGGDIDPAWAKLMSLLLLSLRGNIFLYQGEELGLPQAHVPFERLQDPEALANWPHTMGRDGARTPMPWVADHPLGGFSTAEPWLPMDPHHLPLAVEAQEADPESVLHWTRRLVCLRHESPALLNGSIRFLDAPEGVLAFVRESTDETLLGVFNLGESTVTWTPPHTELGEVLVAIPGESAEAPRTLPIASGYLARCTILAPQP
jgi:alpha-glucosidase